MSSVTSPARWFSILLLLAAVWTTTAAVPPLAQLLPADTLAVFSVPDWDKASAYWSNSPPGKLWQDPALKAFKDKLKQGWKDDFVAPLERQWGVNLAEYLDLFHGQITFAVTQNEWGTRPDGQLGLILIIDTKDKEEALKTRLAEVKRKWIDSGKPLKSATIRNIEFTTFLVNAEALAGPGQTPPGRGEATEDDPLDHPAGPSQKIEAKEITVGQADSLLLVSNNPKEIEGFLARRSGSLAPTLAEQAAYDMNQALFRDALGLAWLNFGRISESFARQSGRGASGGPGNPFAYSTDKLLAAAGLNGVTAVAARIGGSSEGTSVDLVVNIPESRRQGLFRLFKTDRKDASPPAFIGADVVRFRRWRVDGQKAWTTLEGLLTAVSPEVAGLVQLGLQAAGKDRDPNFDLRQTLMGNLGDDFVWLQKPPPRSADLEELNQPPSLWLIGSPKSEELVRGMKVATALMALAGGDSAVEEQEFLGRKVFSLALPSGPVAPGMRGPAPARRFNFAAGGGYAAMAGDISILQEYLRGSESPGKPLRDIAGLVEAAQKVGGMSTGLFGYENQVETMRIWFESNKQQSAAVDKLLSMPLAGGKGFSAEERKNMKESFDISLLPSFDQFSKYFHFIVYSLSTSSDGLAFKLFAPVPPKLN